MKKKRLFAATIVALGLASSIAGASPCVTSNLLALSNTNCTLGNISFQFQQSFENLNGNVVPATNIIATFLVVGNKQFITFTGLPDIVGPTGPNGVFQFVDFTYAAFSLPGSSITGISNVQTGTYSASGPNGSATGFSALSSNQTSSSNSLTGIQCDQNGNCAPFGSNVAVTFPPINFISGILNEENTAFANGSSTGNVATFEFDTVPTGPAVPEPGTLVMIASGLLGAAGALRRKLYA